MATLVEAVEHWVEQVELEVLPAWLPVVVVRMVYVNHRSALLLSSKNRTQSELKLTCAVVVDKRALLLYYTPPAQAERSSK